VTDRQTGKKRIAAYNTPPHSNNISKKLTRVFCVVQQFFVLVSEFALEAAGTDWRSPRDAPLHRSHLSQLQTHTARYISRTRYSHNELG